MRERSSESIRRDAIRTGVQKVVAGCDSCAHGYFDLARTHGATEDEIRTAITKQLGLGAAHFISRRAVLKGIAAGVATGAAVGAGLLPLEAAASSNSYGVDTNTTNCCSMPYTFYIGRFGYQLTQTTSGFNVTAARQCPSKYYAYEYWDLGGPNYPGAPTDMHQWGVNQANAAVSSWYTNPNAPYAYGRTIFADIEANEWWDNPTDQAKNREVLRGWIDGVLLYNPYIWVPGLYISAGNWVSYFGSGYSTTNNFALWLTSCQTCSIGCAPANPHCGGTVSQVDSLYANTVSKTVLGGNPVAVWQYWIGGCAYGGDWDVSSQSCNTYISAYSGSGYVCPGCGAGSPCP
ncbi:MAG: hypothetical protein M3082_08355 [Candidatus Dormibacteraeota bacterium]|nr:hypothetical protein [Candidatus Dormibacteraeota bacterium]